MKETGLHLALLFLLGSFGATAQDKAIEQAAEGNNAFCFELMQEIYAAGENQAFSPFSISTAMAMTYDGAAWRTKWDIGKSMNFHFSRKKNHEAWSDMLDYFRQLKTPIFQWANAVWAQEDFHFEDEFIGGLSDFDAKVEYVDFRNTVEREKGRKAMNQWVESKTEDKIRHLLHKDNIDKMTRMVLINAIYFNADWKYQFDPEKTRTNPFHTRQGDIETEFMTMKSELPFTETKNFEAVRLPYTDELASMYILLPGESSDVDDILKLLDQDGFDAVCTDFEETKLMFAMPKFKVKARYQLKQDLVQLGMIAPFAPYANFSGMNGKRNLVIDDVIHQAHIEVDEQGTEAAAATAVVVREKSAKRPRQFIADKPFVFLIKEHKQGNIIFAGVVENPEM
ncbi:MAG: serpin family protein [Bacteroidota bacterium]